MLLKDLLAAMKYLYCHGSTAIDIKGIAYNSKKVEKGFLFVAIIGFEHDGHDFIGEAFQRGAIAVVVEREVLPFEGITVVGVLDSRQTLALLSAKFYHFPSERLQLIGVTGTNGKTTTTYLLEAIFRENGFQTGLMGTIGSRIGSDIIETERTTPEALDIMQFLKKCLDQGVTHVVMEVSSHALKLKRVSSLSFNAAVFTNISQDHLDFHSSLTDYLQVKSTLFSSIPEDGKGIINMDDPYGPYMKNCLRGEAITYGLGEKVLVFAQDITIRPKGASFTVFTNQGQIQIHLHLSGLFNVYNALAAIGVASSYGIGLPVMKKALEGIQGVAGRFEMVNLGQDFGVIVDYAHSPDGMENILRTAKDLTSNEVFIVFGCGGERDVTKRPLMGKIAARYGDFVIITSDNPRREDPDKIISHIQEGLVEVAYPKEKYQIIPDRREAITSAIMRARSGDLIFIIGKGHETYQILRDKTISFDDREVARKALQYRLGLKNS